MDEHELDELDHAVATALGGVLDGDGWRFDPPLGGDSFIKTKRSFCREWAYGGPIIERERISVVGDLDGGWDAFVCEWLSPNTLDNESPDGCGPTPLIAAMRALVAAAAIRAQGSKT
jgi:hypothetical protein